MKTKVVSVFVLMFILSVIAVPSLTALAKSSDYDYTMKLRVVDGNKLGSYHSLDSGYVKISGYNYETSEASDAPAPYDLKFGLYNSTSGNYFGEVTTSGPDVNDTAYYPRHFSGSFPNAVGGGTHYYLIIWKANDDGHNDAGYGTLSNK